MRDEHGDRRPEAAPHTPRLTPGHSGIGSPRRPAWPPRPYGWPEGEIELRAYGNGRYPGRFMLTPGPAPVPALQARLGAVTLAEQTGAAPDTAGPVRG
ncbi:hypothetical protein [Streptomyces sp. NPDC003480]